MNKNRALSLRDLKFAKTRANIWRTFEELVKTKEYEEITIEEICENAEISRSTFFNYFPSKEHLYTYYGWCFCADVFVKLNEEEIRKTSSYEKIKLVFDLTVKEDQQHSNQFSLFVSHILRRNLNLIKELKYTKADFIYKYPDKADCFKESEDFPIPTISGILYQLVEEGVTRKEFGSNTDINKAVMHLLSVYFSPPILCKFMRSDCSLERSYELLLNDVLNLIH